MHPVKVISYTDQDKEKLMKAFDEDQTDFFAYLKPSEKYKKLLRKRHQI